MAQMELPPAPNYKRTSYSGLLGCDFSVDPSLVNRRRSPDCLNMISDNGGNPVKRKGWEIVNHAHQGAIENIWSFFSDKRYIVFTSKNNATSASLHCMSEDGTEYNLATNGVTIKSGKCCAFYTNTSDTQYGFYIIDGTDYHRIYTDGNGVHYEKVVPYIPTVLISRTPTGGGYIYEDINLLTKGRKEQFLNTEGNKKFIASSVVDTSKPYSLKYKNDDGDWVADTSLTVSASTFTVSTAHEPVVTGQDNILIEYYASGADKSGTIKSCKTCAHFSSTVQDQIFLTGNPSKLNNIYYSAPNDIGYFPDLNYLSIGGDNKIMGFLNIGEYLAVVKEDSSDDSTIFLIHSTSFSSKTLDREDGSTLTTQEFAFAIKRAAAGIGAKSRYAFGVLNDEPLFLSALGIYGVVSTNTTSEKIVRNRSMYLDPRLTKEDGLDNAVCTVWNNYYILAINGHAYILDGRHKTSNNMGNTSYGYEAYFWDNIPAISIMSYEKELWFGSEDGNVCRFKNSEFGTDYSDGTYADDEDSEGVPIIARWSTPNDNDGMTEYFKTMMKKGTMCTVAPYDRSSVKVYISVDGNNRQYIGMAYVDVSNLFEGAIDFERLSFNTNTAPRDVLFKKKKKKYKRLQIILENDELNEPFGVFEIIKTYVYQRFAK